MASYVCTPTTEPLRVLELFSGVGGMHFAIRQTGYPVSSVTAVDINPSANRLYSYNFETTKLLQQNILGISCEFLKQIHAHLWTMSPPCQPFTRQGKKLDLKDERTSAFTHILKLLRELSCEASYLPTYILVENVQGFECSEARIELITTLKETGYTHRELLVSPLQFGIPNSRLRYYLLAKLLPHKFKFDSSGVGREWPIQEITRLTDISTKHEKTANKLEDIGAEECSHIVSKAHTSGQCNALFNIDCCIPKPTLTTKATGHVRSSDGKSASQLSCLTIDKFLTQLSPLDKPTYLLTAATLKKYGKVLDIVYPSSLGSCCFTRAYTHYIQGTGSVLQTGDGSKEATDSAYQLYFQAVEGGLPSPETALIPLELRFFTPREVANLMCFPPDFKFPSDLADKHVYKLLGNSVNVLVISNILRHLLLDY